MSGKFRKIRARHAVFVYNLDIFFRMVRQIMMRRIPGKIKGQKGEVKIWLKNVSDVVRKNSLK